MTDKKLKFGHNVRKHRLVNTVTVCLILLGDKWPNCLSGKKAGCKCQPRTSSFCSPPPHKHSKLKPCFHFTIGSLLISKLQSFCQNEPRRFSKTQAVMSNETRKNWQAMVSGCSQAGDVANTPVLRTKNILALVWRLSESVLRVKLTKALFWGGFFAG